jgi:isoleucyl-tRNA synthetase
MKFKQLKDIRTVEDFVNMEKDVMRFWEEKDILSKYLSKNEGSEKRFSFIDGPITANNPMGVHHAWGRTYKDIFQRYKNMQGYKQRFQNGFDNQGLWVEVEVEKEKGFKCKKDIEEYGIEKFVQDCKDATIKWSLVQREQSKRLGYFMNWGEYEESDYDVIDSNKYSYYTMSSVNNYTIWHFLKTCHEQGWIYEGIDGVPWCPRCGTALSQHEILTEEYEEVTHTSIYFKLPLKDRDNEHLLVWTTTPWTLVANVAVAVNPELEYVKAKVGQETYYILEDLAEKVLGNDFEILEKIKGEKLLDLEYEAPFAEFEAKKGAQHVVIPWDMVEAQEGTGLVHIAPGCGKEDFDLGQELNLKTIMPIDDAGVFLEGFGFLTGIQVQEAKEKIFKYMKEKGFLFKFEEFTHRYPKCWRCKTELLFRVVPEWFISMDKAGKDGRSLRERTIDLVKKKPKEGGTTWIPSFGQDRELDWLNNMHDWMISKKRYWGLALPIWKCEDCESFEVLGSKEELEEKSTSGWKEFDGHTPHRPYIDKVKIKCGQCEKEMERIPDVGNPWLDAGIVPFSTLRYTEDKEYWEKWFPGDFVTECFPGQFKNWFYSLIAMSAVLEDQMPFKTLLGHALVKDQDGEEMHKSKGNSILFEQAANTMGADVTRWLYLRQNPVIDLKFGPKPADEVRRQFYLMLWNTYKFLTIYIDLHKWKPQGKEVREMKLTTLDRWLLSRFEQLKKNINTSLNKYDAMTATRDIEIFVEDMSTWYIRRSRSRFNSGDQVVLEVLYLVLLELTKILAPFIPFTTELIYQNIFLDMQDKESSESIHLEEYPSFDESNIEPDLIEKMKVTREICSSGLKARESVNLNLRQPLAKGYVSIKDDEMLNIVKEELNLKEVIYSKNPVKKDGYVTKGEGSLLVSLDTKLTKELKAEGIENDFLRKYRNYRKTQGYKMGDVISFKISIEGEAREVLENLIKNKSMDIDIEGVEVVEEIANFDKEFEVMGTRIRIGSSRKV